MSDRQSVPNDKQPTNAPREPRLDRTQRITFETTTPAFVGGADPTSTCELRPPSIKGVLRFWFRFREGARQQRNGGASYWRLVAKREDELFGSSRTGVGLVNIRVVRFPGVTQPDGRRWEPGTGYMGYGPVQRDPVRKQFAPADGLARGIGTDVRIRWHGSEGPLQRRRRDQRLLLTLVREVRDSLRLYGARLGIRHAMDRRQVR